MATNTNKLQELLRLETERERLIAELMPVDVAESHAAVAAKEGDPNVKIDIKWWQIINAWSFKPVGEFNCPGCKHHVQFFAKHVGFIFGGHRLVSCGCRLARRAAEAKGQGQGMCGCEWTKDDNYGPITIP